MDIFAGLPPDDVPLVELAQRLEVPVFTRSLRSARGETIQEIYGGWAEQLAHYDYLIILNACMPFLTLATCELAIRSVPAAGEMLAVYATRGPIWDDQFKPLYGVTPEGMNTKLNRVYYTPAHCFYGYRPAVLGTPKMTMFDKLVPITPGPEFLDVDTEADLALVQAVQCMVDGETRVGYDAYGVPFMRNAF